MPELIAADRGVLLSALACFVPSGGWETMFPERAKRRNVAVEVLDLMNAGMRGHTDGQELGYVLYHVQTLCESAAMNCIPMFLGRTCCARALFVIDRVCVLVLRRPLN